MANLLNKLKTVMQENKEDFLYLIFAGAPIGVLHVFFNRFFCYCQLY